MVHENVPIVISFTLPSEVHSSTKKHLRSLQVRRGSRAEGWGAVEGRLGGGGRENGTRPAAAVAAGV